MSVILNIKIFQDFCFENRFISVRHVSTEIALGVCNWVSLLKTGLYVIVKSHDAQRSVTKTGILSSTLTKSINAFINEQ